MTLNFEIIFFIPIAILSLVFITYSILKKKKKSAQSIYKLIDDLEKKYIY